MLGTYDAASRLVSLVHGAEQTDPNTGVTRAPTTELLYNGPGHLIARQFPHVDHFPYHSVMATREVYERDASGRAFRATTYSGELSTADEVVSVDHDQDALGRIHDETYAFGWLDFGKTDTWSVQSTFDSALIDRRQNLTYQSGLTIDHRWDALGRLEGLDWDPQETAVLLANYTHFGYRTSSRELKPDAAAPGGATILTEREFDNQSRLSRIHDRRLQAGTPVLTLSDYAFTYDEFGNLVHEECDRLDGNPSTTNDGDLFTYDHFHRFQEAVLAADLDAQGNVQSFVNKLTYDLDHVGNRENVASEDGAGNVTNTDYQSQNNRYTQIEDLPMPPDPEQIVHDDRGNLIWDKNFLYVFDFKDRLSEVWILVEDEETAEQTTLHSVDTFDSQKLSADIANPAPLAAARSEMLARLQSAPQRIADDVPQMQSRGMLTEPVQLDPNTTLTTSSGQSYTAQNSTAEPSLQLIALYAYDPFDRRVGRLLTAANETWLHVYDGWREIEELLVTQPDGSGNEGTKVPAKQFVWGERLDELVAYRRFGVLPGGGLGWETFHATQLGHESVTRLLDADGDLVEQIVYDPFGMPQVHDASENYVGESSGRGLPFLWKGHRVDPETDLVYIRHRYYLREWGRFLSVDPIGGWGDPVSLGNAYVYAGNAPTVYYDPLGFQADPGEGRWDSPFSGALPFPFLVRSENVAIYFGPHDHLEPGQTEVKIHIHTRANPNHETMWVEYILFFVDDTDRTTAEVAGLVAHEILHGWGYAFCVNRCVDGVDDSLARRATLEGMAGIDKDRRECLEKCWSFWMAQHDIQYLVQDIVQGCAEWLEEVL